MSHVELIRLDLPGTVKYLNVLGACVAAILEREEAVCERDLIIYQVQLAVHELCANIVEHAYGDTPGRIVITLTMRAEPHSLIIETCDYGRSFDPSLVPEPDPLSDRGRGLYIKRQFANEITYHAREGQGWRSRDHHSWYGIDEPHPQPETNYWRLVKHLKHEDRSI